MEVGCYYFTWQATAFGWTQVLPTFVTMFLTFTTYVTHEVIFFMYGLFLHGMQWILWCIQVQLAMERPDPNCQQYHTYAFPSIESFYVYSIIAFIIAYGILWKGGQGWIVLTALLIVSMVFPAAMVWFSYNLWWEVLFSAILGILTTAAFVVVLRLYIAPSMPFLLTQAPLSWMGYNDTFCMNKKQQEECRKLKDFQDMLSMPVAP